MSDLPPRKKNKKGKEILVFMKHTQLSEDCFLQTIVGKDSHPWSKNLPEI